MNIEGLNATETKRDGFVEASVAPQGQGSHRHISLKVSPKGTATAELLEGRQRPGIEHGEFIPMAVYSEDIGDRVVRAMAKVHFHASTPPVNVVRIDVWLHSSIPILRAFVIT